jgi:hypothetical protein
MTAVQALCRTMKIRLVTVRSQVLLVSGTIVAEGVGVRELVCRAIGSSSCRRINTVFE